MELPRNIKALTGVRGYAALWVVFYHLKGNPYFLSICTPGELVRHGFLGVDVFFVLSGFVLSHVYESKFWERVEPNAYLRYLGLRLARLYPLHVVTLVAAFAYFIMSHTIGNGTADSSAFSPYDAIMNLTLLHAWGTTQQLTWNGPSWSISAEWFAYLFLLVPCVRLLRKAPLKALYALISTLWCLLILVYVPRMPQQNLDIMPFGIVRIVPEFIAGYVAFRTVKAIRCKQPLGDLMCFVGLIGIAFITYQDTFRVFLLPMILLFIVGLSTEERIVSAFFSNRLSVFLGEISYSIYMCHAIVLWFSYPVCERLNLQYTPATGMFVVTVYLLVVLLSAYLLYIFVERPCREWARKGLTSLSEGSETRRRA